MRKVKPKDNQLLLFDIPVEKPPEPAIKPSKQTPTEQTSNEQYIDVEKYSAESISNGLSAREILALAKEEQDDICGVIDHENQRTLASIDRRHRLRLHHIFFFSNEKVIRSLVRYLNGKARPDDNEIIRHYLSNNSRRSSIDDLTNRRVKGCYGSVGMQFDLDEILRDVMRKYTGEVENILITWREPSKGSRSITWGTYRRLEDGGLIKINALLDKLEVPRYVVESVVHHELVHHFVPTKVKNKRRVIHGKRFKEILSVNPNIKKADKWIKSYSKKIMKQHSKGLQ